MDRNVDWLLLERWIAGECSPDEATAVQHWVAADAANARLAAVMRAAWARTGEVSGAPRDVAAAWSSLASKLQAAPPRRVLHLLPARSSAGMRIRAAAVGVAAALLLLVGGMVVWRVTGRPAGHPAMSLQQVATAAGQRSTATLDDGTRVLVGPASRVRFASRFDRRRDVYLEGEAFFEVAHDASRPFVVHTARGTARALGTKFNVDAYGNSPEMAVLVTEGAVALKGTAAPNDSLVLRKADLGQLRVDGALVLTAEADVARHLAWIRGELVFDRTPVTEVIRELVRWYGVDVQLGDSVLARHAVTASLSGQSAAGAIQTVAAALHARVEQRGLTYVLLARR